MMNISNIRSAAKFKQTVLVIDDQLTVLNIHVAILNSLKMNLNIVAMTNPVEALTWIVNKQVDLIVTDFSMHQMNGIEFVQTIKNSCGDRLIPIIVVTVLNNEKIRQELILAGVYACLSKPVQTKELAKISKFLLEKSDDYNQSLFG